jgi:hypothetical protein
MRYFLLMLYASAENRDWVVGCIESRSSSSSYFDAWCFLTLFFRVNLQPEKGLCSAPQHRCTASLRRYPTTKPPWNEPKVQKVHFQAQQLKSSPKIAFLRLSSGPRQKKSCSTDKKQLRIRIFLKNIGIFLQSHFTRAPFSFNKQAEALRRRARPAKPATAKKM